MRHAVFLLVVLGVPWVLGVARFGFGVPERTCAIRGELQLPAVSTLTLGD
jgi:hypothetical protein